MRRLGLTYFRTPQCDPDRHRTPSKGRRPPARVVEETGLPRYWIIDPEGPHLSVFELEEGASREFGRWGPGETVELTVGPTTLSLDPASLLD